MVSPVVPGTLKSLTCGLKTRRCFGGTWAIVVELMVAVTMPVHVSSRLMEMGTDAVHEIEPVTEDVP